MERQHRVPILLSSSSGGTLPLEHLTERASGGGVGDAFIRDLVHQHPACLPTNDDMKSRFSWALPMNITSRFLNVIGLFNGAIPLIALQMPQTTTKAIGCPLGSLLTEKAQPR